MLNLGKYKLPEKERFEYSGDFSEFDKISADYIRPVPLETKQFLIIQFGKWLSKNNISALKYKDQKVDLLGVGIFDKKKNLFSIISEDIGNYPCFFPNFSDKKNCLISYIDALNAIDFYNQNKHTNLIYPPFIQIVKKLQEGDNPVIIMKLKD